MKNLFLEINIKINNLFLEINIIVTEIYFVFTLSVKIICYLCVINKIYFERKLLNVDITKLLLYYCKLFKKQKKT